MPPCNRGGGTQSGRPARKTSRVLTPDASVCGGVSGNLKPSLHLTGLGHGDDSGAGNTARQAPACWTSRRDRGRNAEPRADFRSFLSKPFAIQCLPRPRRGHRACRRGGKGRTDPRTARRGCDFATGAGSQLRAWLCAETINHSLSGQAFAFVVLFPICIHLRINVRV